MKYLILPLVLFLLGCSKDPLDQNVKEYGNHFKIGDEIVNIAWALWDSESLDSNTPDSALVLISDDFDFKDCPLVFDEDCYISGIGRVFAFTFPPFETKPLSQKYYYTGYDDGDSWFSGGYHLDLNWNTGPDEPFSENSILIKSGTIEVTQLNSGEYVIVFDLVNEDAVPITGYFKGKDIVHP